MSEWRYINMRPFGKARPRVTRNGTFMPKDYTNKKNSLKQLYGPVDEHEFIKLELVAVRRIPKNGRSNSVKVYSGGFCKVKPDLDNIEGAIMDALYPESDSQVVIIDSQKIWGDDDWIEIRISAA